MGFLINLALKTIRRHPVQSGITVLSIALGVAIVLAALITNAALKKSVTNITEELGTGKTAIWLLEATENNAGIGRRQEGFSEEIGSQIIRNPGVQSIHPSVKVFTTAVSVTQPAAEECCLYGIDFSGDRTVRNHLLSMGNYPVSPNQALVGEYYREQLKLRIGSPIAIRSPKGKLTLRVAGFLSWDKGSGIINKNRVVFADLALVQEYFGYYGKVTELNIVLQPERNKSQVVEEITPLLPSNVKAITDPIADAAANDQTQSIRASNILFTFIIIIIAGFIIYNTLFSSIEQSRKELGLLRLIGMTPGQIFRFFLIQALLYAIFGSGLGIGFGMLLSYLLLYLVNTIFQYQSILFELPSFGAIMVSAGIGIIGALLIGIFPALKASKTAPLDLFTSYGYEKNVESKFNLKALLGLLFILIAFSLSFLPIRFKIFLYIRFSAPVFLFVGLCMVIDLVLPVMLRLMTAPFSHIFGFPGLLGVKSLCLRLKRTATTVCAITVAVAIIIGYLGMTINLKNTISDWLDKTKWADLIIFSTSGAEIDSTILAKIKGFPFVENVNPLRYYFIPYQHHNLSDNGFLFQGVDPASFREFTGIKISHGAAGNKDSFESPSLIVNQNLANKIGLKIGDSIRLKTNQGPVSFLITDTVADYSDFIHRLGKIVYGPYDYLVKYWGITGYSAIQVRLAKDFSPDAAKKELLSGLTDQYNIKIITHAEEKIGVRKSINRVFGIFYAINGMIFIIVFMSIFNTVLINVLFQIREYALLRIAGCFAKEIRMMVLCEALILAFIGVLLAALAGWWLAGEMTLSSGEIIGIRLNSYPIWVLAFTFLVMTLISALIATYYPQKVATKTSIAAVLQRMEEI